MKFENNQRSLCFRIWCFNPVAQGGSNTDPPVTWFQLNRCPGLVPRYLFSLSPFLRSINDIPLKCFDYIYVYFFQLQCVTYGSKLVEIENKDENNFLKNILIKDKG